MENTQPFLNIGMRGSKVNNGLNTNPSNGSINGSISSSGGSDGSFWGGSSIPMTVTGINPHAGTAVPPNVHTVTAAGTVPMSSMGWQPGSAVDAFLKIQYTQVEVRCAITRKMVPAGSPVMLLGGMVISAEAFERWLEEHLSSLICRHTDLHTDTSGYDE
jgi:hypothetical protein